MAVAEREWIGRESGVGVEQGRGGGWGRLAELSPGSRGDHNGFGPETSDMAIACFGSFATGLNFASSEIPEVPNPVNPNHAACNPHTLS